jgi:hypothetical protein
MAVTAFWYGKALLAAFNEEIDWAADTIKVQLHTSSYVPSQDHDYHADLTNEVANGNGYTTGGATLGTPTIGYTAGTGVVKFDGEDVQWTSSTITARYAVIVDTTPGSSATNPLILYVDFGQDEASSNGNFTIQWHTDGIATITVTIA